jgi:hypothetical protein
MPRSDPNSLLPDFAHRPGDKKPIVRNVLDHTRVRELQDYIKKQQQIIEADPKLTLDGIAEMATAVLGYTVKGTNVKSAMLVMGVRKGASAKLSTHEAIRLLALATLTALDRAAMTDEDLARLERLADRE